MRVIVAAMAVMLLVSVSLCLAQDISLEKARALFNKGQQEEAIQMMEDYVVDNPDPKVYYFLGYAYYEMKDMEKAAEYFDKAYVKEPFYSPMENEKK